MMSHKILSVLINIAFIHVARGMKVVVIGDWGDNSANGMIRQENVARALNDWCGTHGCDYIVSTGDNFYNNGVFSVDDERFNTSWRYVYDKPNIRHLQWYQSLGNHDYGTIDSREMYQIEFGLTEPRWYLPWLYYGVIKQEDDLTVELIELDAMSVLLRKHDWQEQLHWYEETLAASTADWLIVFEHYPPYTTGNYQAGSLVHRNNYVPLAEQYNVDFFFSGHDHNMQHIAKRFEPDIDYIVSGGGGRGLYEFDSRGNNTLHEWGFQVKHFGYYNGFVWMDINKQQATAYFINSEGSVSYAFTRMRRNNL